MLRMDDGAPTKEVFQWDVKDNRRRGRPNLRWKDQVAKNLEQHGINNRKKAPKDRVAGRGIIKTAQFHVGLNGR